MSAVVQGVTARLRVDDAIREWRRGGHLPGVLPVVDGDELTPSTTDALERAGIHAERFTDPASVLTALRQRPPQVVVLSARAPVPDPADLVARLRLDLHCPVLVALGDGDVARAAPAIVAGGTPALSLPLAPTQLLRVLTPVWIDPPRPEVTLRLGSLELDHARLAARVGGRRLQTSVTEFAVLWRLAQRAGAVVPREDLWPLWAGARDPDGALVAAVTRVRARLHALGVAQSIVTLRGVGYRWDDPADMPDLAHTRSGAVITA